MPLMHATVEFTIPLAYNNARAVSNARSLLEKRLRSIGWRYEIAAETLVTEDEPPANDDCV